MTERRERRLRALAQIQTRIVRTLERTTRRALRLLRDARFQVQRWLKAYGLHAATLVLTFIGWFLVTLGLAHSWRFWVVSTGILLLVYAGLVFAAAVLRRV